MALTPTGEKVSEDELSVATNNPVHIAGPESDLPVLRREISAPDDLQIWMPLFERAREKPAKRRVLAMRDDA